MTLSNSTLAVGTLGVIFGGLVGVAVGRNLGEGSKDPDAPPLALGLFGALAGGVLFAAIGNSLAPATTTSSQTSSNSQVLQDNTQNANGLPNLPPPGA